MMKMHRDFRCLQIDSRGAKIRNWLKRCEAEMCLSLCFSRESGPCCRISLSLDIRRKQNGDS
jgi:hypothetical protein